VILQALMFVYFAVCATAEEIKSADGSVIEAKFVEGVLEGAKLDKDGTVFLVPWEKLDAEQALKLKERDWLKIEEDRFDGVVTCRTRAYPALVDVLGHTKIDPDTVSFLPNPPMLEISFDRFGQTFLFTREEVKMLIDGERAGFIAAFRSEPEATANGRAHEHMRALITHEVWAKMKDAKKVEVRVGELEMGLSEETLMSFRLLMDYTQRRWEAMREEALKKQAEKIHKITTAQ